MEIGAKFRVAFTGVSGAVALVGLVSVVLVELLNDKVVVVALLVVGALVVVVTSVVVGGAGVVNVQFIAPSSEVVLQVINLQAPVEIF